MSSSKIPFVASRATWSHSFSMESWRLPATTATVHAHGPLAKPLAVRRSGYARLEQRGGSIFNWLAGAATDRSCDPPVATGSCQNQTVDCDYNATARKYTIFYESVFLDDWRLNFLPPIKAVKLTCMQWQKLWRYYDLCYVITIVMQ